MHLIPPDFRLIRLEFLFVMLSTLLRMQPIPIVAVQYTDSRAFYFIHPHLIIHRGQTGVMLPFYAKMYRGATPVVSLETTR